MKIVSAQGFFRSEPTFLFMGPLLFAKSQFLSPFQLLGFPFGEAVAAGDWWGLCPECYFEQVKNLSYYDKKLLTFNIYRVTVNHNEWR